MPGMSDDLQKEQTLADDERTPKSMGYRQELARRMSGFSNFAISLSIIRILAGGIASFQVVFCSAGGASIGFVGGAVALLGLTWFPFVRTRF
jgi:hypothetical protein